MKNIILLVLVVVIVGGVYYYFNSQTEEGALLSEIDTETNMVMNRPCSISDISVLYQIESLWSSIERDIEMRPVLGATTWTKPYHAQFIGNDNVLVAFEDGHVVATAVVNTDCSDAEMRSISVLAGSERDFPLSQTEWADLIAEYGERQEMVKTYTDTPEFIDGLWIERDGWTPVTENIFVNY